MLPTLLKALTTLVIFLLMGTVSLYTAMSFLPGLLGKVGAEQLSAKTGALSSPVLAGAHVKMANLVLQGQNLKVSSRPECAEYAVSVLQQAARQVTHLRADTPEGRGVVTATTSDCLVSNLPRNEVLTAYWTAMRGRLSAGNSCGEYLGWADELWASEVPDDALQTHLAELFHDADKKGCLRR